MEQPRSGRDLLAVVMMCLTVTLCVWLYTHRTRFVMVPCGERAYKLDRITGQLWLLNGDSYGEVRGLVKWAR